jgi:tripartite-type tricarboxylate transporter receptor subunit TctC
MLKRKTFTVGLAVLLVSCALLPSAFGKEYPEKSIEVVVPYTAGSSFDVLARIVAELAPKYLNQPMIVVNKAGAAGALTAADVISAAPDGYKVALLTTVFFSTATKTQKVPFNPTDLTPIANFSEQKIALVVKGDAPWKSLADLLKYAQQNKGGLRWSHPGRGTISHTNGLILFRKAGVEATDIPYKGGPELLTSLLGGHVETSIITVGMLRDQVKAGKIRPLVFLSDSRYSDYPDVPSVAEAGFPEAGKVKVLLGFYVRKNTPENVKKTLIDACKKIYGDPQFSKKVEELGDEPRFATPESMKETIKKEEDINVPLLKELGLYVGSQPAASK